MKNLITNYREKTYVSYKDTKIVAASFFLRLSDKSLSDIQDNKISISNVETMIKLLREKGKNIHFLFAAAKSMGDIREGIREVVKYESPKTVSWVNEKTNNLKVFSINRRG